MGEHRPEADRADREDGWRHPRQGTSPLPWAGIAASLWIVRIDQIRGAAREGRGTARPRCRAGKLLDHELEEARSHGPQQLISVDLRKRRAASKALLAAASDGDVLVIGTHNREVVRATPSRPF